MPTFQVVTIFNQGRSGWTETYYMTADNFAEVQLRSRAIAGDRARLLGKGNSIDAIRISDVEVLNDSLLTELGTDAPTQDAVTDTPWNSIYVRASAGSLHRRAFHLRGVPDSWIVIDPVSGKGVIPAVATDAFRSWRTEMTRNAPAAQMKVAIKDNAGVFVTGAPQQDGLFTKVNVGLVTYPADSYVLFKKWKGPDKKLLNRRWDIIGYANPWLTVSLQFALLTEAAANYGGKVLKRSPGYADITVLSLLRFASKKTGRAFFVAPGKSKGKGK